MAVRRLVAALFGRSFLRCLFQPTLRKGSWCVPVGSSSCGISDVGRRDRPSREIERFAVGGSEEGHERGIRRQSAWFNMVRLWRRLRGFS